MVAKFYFVLFATALFAEYSLAQCLSRIAEPISPCRSALAYDGLGYGQVWPARAGCGSPAVDLAAASSLSAAHGGGLSVTSSSCAAPTGLAVASDNIYEGCVGVNGNLPFLGTAAMEGVFPTAGVSAISYGCGDGVVAITAEGPIDAAFAPMSIAPAAIASAAIAPTVSSWGYKGLPARDCGCGCGAGYLY